MRRFDRISRVMGGLCAVALLALCLLAIAGAAFAADVPLSLVLGGEVIVETDGSVRSCTVERAPSPQVEAMVKNAVQQWTFEPIVRNGAPVAARTGYSVRLVAVPADKGYRLRIDDVWFSNPRGMVKQGLMIEPTMMRGMSQSIAVLGALRVDKDGHVVEAAVLDVVALGDGSKKVRNVAGWEKEIVRLLRGWQWEPARLDLGDPENLDGVIRINIIAGRGGALDQWRQPDFSGAKPVPWDTGEPINTDALKDGQVAFHGDDVKLRSDVVGKML